MMQYLFRLKQSVVLFAVIFVMTQPLVGCGVSMLSAEQEVAIGEENAPKFRAQQGGAVPDAQLNAYVTEIGMKMVKHIASAEQRKFPWEFNVLNSSTVNAFALPGGKIFITRGLMEKLSNEAELAGVLGHEVGHVVEKHVGKQMTQAMILKYGLDLASQYSESQWVSVIGGTGGQLYLLRFGRSQELEADSVGMDYMIRAGYDPKGLVGVMKVLAGAGGGRTLEMLSTHPHPESRIIQANQFLGEKYADTQNNPKYILGKEAYETRALARLRKLGPPKHGPK